MPAWTPLGVKSSSRDAYWFGRSPPEVPPHPASRSSAAHSDAFNRDTTEHDGRTGIVPAA
jgi:hypothetical protein